MLATPPSQIQNLCYGFVSAQQLGYIASLFWQKNTASYLWLFIIALKSNVVTLKKILKNSTQSCDDCPPIQNVELASPDSGEVRADVDQIILHPDYVVRKP